jgi:hypothetical protein
MRACLCPRHRIQPVPELRRPLGRSLRTPPSPARPSDYSWSSRRKVRVGFLSQPRSPGPLPSLALLSSPDSPIPAPLAAAAPPMPPIEPVPSTNRPIWRRCASVVGANQLICLLSFARRNKALAIADCDRKATAVGGKFGIRTYTYYSVGASERLGERLQWPISTAEIGAVVGRPGFPRPCPSGAHQIEAGGDRCAGRGRAGSSNGRSGRTAFIFDDRDSTRCSTRCRADPGER